MWGAMIGAIINTLGPYVKIREPSMIRLSTFQNHKAASSRILTLDQINILFSYETPVAFYDPANGVLFARYNEWGHTTAKHINIFRKNIFYTEDQGTIVADLNEQDFLGNLRNTIQQQALEQIAKRIAEGKKKDASDN